LFATGPAQSGRARCGRAGELSAASPGAGRRL